MDVKRILQPITKRSQPLLRHIRPLAPWTVFFAALALAFCIETGILIVQHNNGKHVKSTNSSHTAALDNLCAQGEQSCSVLDDTTPRSSTAPSTSTPANNGSASSYAGTKTPAASPSAPIISTVTMCDYDTYDKSTLAHEYLYSEDFLIDMINSYKDVQPASSALAQLNSAITSANTQYVQAYDEYVNTRREYNCTITFSAPAPMPQCADTGWDMVADCIASITANEPALPAY